MPPPQDETRRQTLARAVNAHGHDINVVVLLVADGRGKVARQPQREFPLAGRLHLVPKQRDMILKVFLANRGHELQLHGRSVLAGQHS